MMNVSTLDNERRATSYSHPQSANDSRNQYGGEAYARCSYDIKVRHHDSNTNNKRDKYIYNRPAHLSGTEDENCPLKSMMREAFLLFLRTNTVWNETNSDVAPN